MKTFEKKLIEYIPNLRRYAIALTAKSSTQADDLLQDTLERALQKRSLWVRDSNLRAWLFTIMHNLFINQIKRIDANQLDDLETITKKLYKMEMKLEEMLNKVIDQLQSVAKTETVIGESFKLGEFECVPVIKIGMGFGSGGGGGETKKIILEKEGELQQVLV